MATLRELRDAAGLSQMEVARQLEIDRRRVISAEQNGSDSLSLLRGMASLYGVDLSVVIDANHATGARGVQKMLQKA